MRRFDPRRCAPSGRSLLAGFAIVAAAAGGYGVARVTPLFEIRTIEVVGATPQVRRGVQRALEPVEGTSLVGLSTRDLDRRLAALPEVMSATYDRAFPHTLRVDVLPEQPLLVLRRGRDSWLVSARGRVVRELEKGAHAKLPRLWVPKTADVEVGTTLGDGAVQRGVAILALARAELPGRVRTVKLVRDDAVLVLRSGVEVRLGSAHDLPLKLAVASEVLPQLPAAATYLDVAVPDRPVSDGVG